MQMNQVASCGAGRWVCVRLMSGVVRPGMALLAGGWFSVVISGLEMGRREDG